jgi:type II secretory pathway component PulF
MGEMLLSSGRGIQDLLVFSKDSSRNIVYKDIFEKMYVDSVSGVSLSISLSKYKLYFPIIMIDMVNLGERTGNLGVMLGHCSKIFEQDIDNALKRFTSLIEPVLMVLMGLIVGSIALSIILPVYEITNHISK